MRDRRRNLLLAAPLGVVVALLSSAASPAEGPAIEAGGGGPYYWRPSSASVGPGGTVVFKNSSALVPHGVTWTGGPESPHCSGVPIEEGKTSWSGSCSFAQPGTYSFKCTVHPEEMRGTISVSEAGTTSPPPPPGGPSPESLLAGPASRALKLAGTQRGEAVRGSIALSGAAAGGRLEVDLIARRATLLGAAHPGSERVGRLVRSPLRAGRTSFAVTPKGSAGRLLRSGARLRLSVQILLTPLHGAGLKLKRGVVLHG